MLTGALSAATADETVWCVQSGPKHAASGWHAAAPASDRQPLLQGTHAASPGARLCVPAGHAAQPKGPDENPGAHEQLAPPPAETEFARHGAQCVGVCADVSEGHRRQDELSGADLKLPCAHVSHAEA